MATGNYHDILILACVRMYVHIGNLAIQQPWRDAECVRTEEERQAA